ncbi:MAG: HAMP domain-containing protein [Comamonas sp.]|nr:HAMP domain-containing protein [Candidatus Comamonas equi]
MNLSNIRVAPKLWATILGLLLIMTLVNLWVQQATMATMQTSREDVQRIEQKIALAETMRGKILRSIETGTALLATNEARLQKEFEARFQRLYKIAFVALNEEMPATLRSDRDRASFDVVLSAFEDLKTSREKFFATMDVDDFNARANYAFGEYTTLSEVYGSKIQDFIDLQRLQLKELMQAADDSRKASNMLGWVTTAILLLLGVLLAHWLVTNITRPLQEAVALTETIGDGKLDIQVNSNRQDEFGQLLTALSQMAGKLRTVIGEVRSGVDAVSSAAGQIASGNQDLSSRTEQSAASLQQTAASIEQMTASVNQASDTSRQANQLAATAVQAATRGGEVVQQVVESMEQINASSRKISDIIGVIDGIAFQTNILALNAAVEAARAGEQGRGFAVVAGEVRSLAGRSAEAAKEIKALISASVSTVDAGSVQVSQAGSSMEEIVSSVRRVTDLIGEITASSTEQHQGFSQVNQAVNNLDQMTQQNAALVEESSAAANAMNDQAQRLLQAVSVFDLGHTAASHTQRQHVAVNSPMKSSKPAATRAPAVERAQRLQKPATIAAKPQAPSPKAASEDDWETF